MRRPTSPTTAAMTGLLTAAVGLALAVPGATAYAADDGEQSPGVTQSVADDSGSLREQAVEALDDVQGLLTGADPASEPGVPALTADGRDLTIALRDLAALRGSLPPAQQREAERVLARPTDSTGASYGATYRVDEATPLCSPQVCVHYVTSTGDASTRAYARQMLRVVSKVDTKYVGAGYRRPKRDGNAKNDGGNPRPDIYLADIGGQSVYGFCTTDQPFELGTFDAWAYCVLDNDYAKAQFPQNTPVQNLKVTAAHEYFHAVQFGYDYTEDDWFLEGTATWAEDQVFDGINDNVSYLRFGPMGKPALVMDEDRGKLEVYGSWSFFRFLTERYPSATNGLPKLMLDFWKRADSVGNAPDDFSLQAVRNVLKARGVDVSAAFADYAAANLHPAASYREGRVNEYPAAPVSGKRKLGPKNPTYKAKARTKHLTSRSYRLGPVRQLKSGRWAVRLAVSVPAPSFGGQVRLTVTKRDGTSTIQTIKLNRRGQAVVRRPFSARQVRTIEVSLVNASTRLFDCYSLQTTYSCQGRAKDDGRGVALAAKLYLQRR